MECQGKTLRNIFMFLIVAIVVIFALALTSGMASATTHVVNQTAACTDGDYYYTSIQAAVWNASSGDTIYVCPGTYNETVDVKVSNIVISAFNETKPVVSAVNDPNDHVFDITGQTNVTLEGFEIRDAHSTTQDVAAGIYLQSSSNNTLTNNTVSNNKNGIWVSSLSNSNLISNNTANSNNNYGIFLLASNGNLISNNTATANNLHGIYLQYSGNNTITNNTTNSNTNNGIWLSFTSNSNTITNNTANSNTNNGIWLEHSSNNTLTNNTANSNTNYGIWLSSSSNNNTITSHTASNNYYGIFLSYSNGNLISNNNVSNNNNGIWLSLWSNSNTITNNTANSNTWDGITLEESSSSNTLTSNTVYSNSNYSILLKGSKGNLIYNNYFNNTNNAYDDGTNTWNFTKTLGTNIIGGPYLGGNYWSDYAGEDTNDEDGLGDTLLPYNASGGIQDSGDYLPLVYQENVAPTVDAGPNQTVNEGDTVSFAGNFSNPDELDTHTIDWDFGDGSTATGNVTPTHVYDDNGVYTVTLTVTDDDGGVGTDTLTVTANNVAPTVDAGEDQTADEGDTVLFSGNFTDPGMNDTHTIDWDFGDGSPTVTGTLTPTHAYEDNGVYTVNLTVTDDDGGVGFDTLTVTVNNVALTVNAGPDQTVDEGANVSFSGSFTDPDTSDTHTIEWDFGDGSAATGNLTPTHAYEDNGVYTVNLTVTDDDGGVGTDTLTVTVNNVAPTVDAGEDQTVNEGDTVLFFGNFTDPGLNDMHTIDWDFGDGSNATGNVTPTHVYAANSTYTVTMTVTDNDGGIGTATITVVVNTPNSHEGVDIAAIDEYIQGLPDDAFKNNPGQRKKAFSNKLGAVIKLIEEEEYQEAKDKLQHDIRAKADGHVDGDLKNDWITDETAQQDICGMIDEVIEYLETLL
jgi:parallel beta-helix repeat protein